MAVVCGGLCGRHRVCHLGYTGREKDPVQYAKRVVGRKMYGGQSTHIPMKVNVAGVIPIIFAMSILAFFPHHYWSGGAQYNQQVPSGAHEL